MLEYLFVHIDLNNDEHCRQLIRLLDVYMQDEMGNGAPMKKDLAPKILDGLRKHESFLGFFVLVDGYFAALANCNKNFSTFRAKPLINIHDFVVHPDYRGKGVGQFLLDSIYEFGRQNGYCKINLEVREDNHKAQQLYEKAGYEDCKPRMHFWEKVL